MQAVTDLLAAINSKIGWVGSVLAGTAAVAVSAKFLLSRASSTRDAPAHGATMRKLELLSPSADVKNAQFRVATVPVPTPRSGQVLVRMAAAPVNPSDYGSWLMPREGATYPIGIGNEGSGVVVASGGGFIARRLVGQNVGVVARNVGSYAEYVCVDALTEAFPLGDQIKVEDGAAFFVNPYTAVGILDTVTTTHGQKTLIHTAAASQLGQMLVRLAPQFGVQIVNIVRRPDQVEILKALGAKYIVSTGDADWEDQLKKLIQELDIKVAFECIAGTTPGQILSMMPNRSCIYIYGALSQQPIGGIHPMDLIYRNKEVRGFLLPTWLQQGGMLKTIFRIRRASAMVNAGLLPGGWAESQFTDCSMEEMPRRFLEMYDAMNSGGFTGKKLRIRLG